MRTLIIAVIMLPALAVLVAAQLGAFQSEDRALALDDVYATFNQEGFKPLDTTVSHDDVSQAAAEAEKNPQQIALCVGEDLAAAVKASAASFALAGEEAAVISGAPGASLWLAAYLGSDGSVPPAYKVRGIDVMGKTIRVSYERVEAAARSCDHCAYIIWAPVGLVENAAYTLELFDAAAGVVTLTREWRVVIH